MGKGTTVKKIGWLGMALLLTLPGTSAWATHYRPFEISKMNKRLKGKLLDFTHNHGRDNRIWSRSLQQKRDLYVYLPPCYDPHDRYPIMILFHGFGMDEKIMLKLVESLDEAIASGKLPPLIVAAPDGTISGEPCMLSPGSFYLNSQAGDFEDFVIQDVWDFMARHFPIRSERQAHVLAGVSMGGFSAFNLAIRHREGFGVAMGVFPPLNLRWVNKSGKYRANFDPYDWGWRTMLNPDEVMARPFGVALRVRSFIEPLYGTGEDALVEIMNNNPIELVTRTNLCNGELEMYVCYAGKDELNIDAQVESFLYLCKFRGLGVGVGYAPNGHHDMPTAFKLIPGMLQWLAPRLAPYGPPLRCASAGNPDNDGGTCAPGIPPNAPLPPVAPPPPVSQPQDPEPLPPPLNAPSPATPTKPPPGPDDLSPPEPKKPSDTAAPLTAVAKPDGSQR